jgi:hypothetical protein
MKRAENRLKVDKLFVFGAGASYCATQTNGIEKQSPLDKDFCSRIRNVTATRPTWVESSRDTVIRAWRDHQPFESYGLEQAIIRHLGHSEFKRAIHKRANQGVPSDPEYMNHLSHLICYILRKAREGRTQSYRQFAERFFRTSRTRNRAITFNYDELLDNHLAKIYSPQELYFDRFDLGPISSRRQVFFHDPALIKLHGSVNWRCSKEDLTSIVEGIDSEDEYVIDSIWHSEKGTPSPEDDSSPLIIPPLPSKPITKIRLFCFLWTKAYEYLHEASDLVICGYSLPDADQLAQSMFANFSNKTLNSVTIIDPNPEILKKWRDLFRRSNINSRARWTYHESFTEYVANGA